MQLNKSSLFSLKSALKLSVLIANVIFLSLNLPSLLSVKNKSKHLEQPLEVLYKKGVLKKFAKFRGKHQCQSHVFIKVAG